MSEVLGRLSCESIEPSCSARLAVEGLARVVVASVVVVVVARVPAVRVLVARLLVARDWCPVVAVAAHVLTEGVAGGRFVA